MSILHEQPADVVDALRSYLGPQVQFEISAAGTEITTTYSQASRRLKELFGPTARFERFDEHGVQGVRASVLRNGAKYILISKFGPPDWAHLLLATSGSWSAWLGRGTHPLESARCASGGRRAAC